MEEFDFSKLQFEKRRSLIYMLYMFMVINISCQLIEKATYLKMLVNFYL